MSHPLNFLEPMVTQAETFKHKSGICVDCGCVLSMYNPDPERCFMHSRDYKAKQSIVQDEKNYIYSLNRSREYYDRKLAREGRERTRKKRY